MTELFAKCGSASNDGLSVMGGKAVRRILVVDDHADTRALLRYVFEGHRYQVIEAADGAEAIGLAATNLPDLILMDTSLQNVDGLEATRRIRQMSTIANVPILFLSGHAQPQARALALASGANEYLVKPVSLEELEIVVERQLSGSQTAKLPASDGHSKDMGEQL